MEPKFSGPSFTIGIEEELMIVDEETLDKARALIASRARAALGYRPRVRARRRG